jgi:hypothetical protein
MTIRAVKNSSQVVCSGYLTANRPVRYAPVYILWEGHDPLTLTTDAQGFFSLTLRLPAGYHRLRAWFENESYPIGPSMSAIFGVTSTGVEVPSVTKEQEARFANGTIRYTGGEPQASFGGHVADTMSRVLPGAFVGLLAAVAALGYLRRGVRKDEPGATPPPSPREALHPSLDIFRDVPAAIPPEEPLGDLYLRSLRELGLSGAAYLVYSRFASIIGGHTGIRNPSRFTAREIARASADRPYGKVFHAFVRCYELVRYAGQKGDRVRRGFEYSMESTQTALEGEER